MDHEAKIEPVALSEEETAVLTPEKQDEAAVEEVQEIAALKQQSPVEAPDDRVVDADVQEEREARESEEASVEEITLSDKLADSEEAEDEEIGGTDEQENRENIIDEQEVRAEIKENVVEGHELINEAEPVESAEEPAEQHEIAEVEEEVIVGIQETIEGVEDAKSEEESIIEAQTTVGDVEEIKEEKSIVEAQETVEGAKNVEASVVENQEAVEDVEGIKDEKSIVEEIKGEEESVVDAQEIVEGVGGTQEIVEEMEGKKDEGDDGIEKQEVTPVVVVASTLAKVGKKRRLSPVMSAFLLFLAIIIGGGGLIGVGYYYQSVRQPLSTFVRPVERNPTPGMTPTSGYESIQGRSFNLLLLGSDDDEKYVFPALITQVMMIVRVDTVTKTVTMVSIPRDSWVRVPEVGGMHKIGQAFLLGALAKNNSFEGGVQLARMTVELNYGVPIDRYAWVGLNGFAKVIDRLGGVDVDVLHPIVDDTYPDDVGKVDDPNNPYGYKRIYIPAGPQHLNGHEALEYVRSRHSDLIGDIGRTHRQQQILEALKGKLSVGNLIGRLPELLEDLTGSVYTDLNEDEMMALAYFGRELGSNSIKRITLGFDDGERNFGQGTSLYDPWVGAYQYVILPNCEAIEPVVNEIFGLGDANSCNVRG